MCVCVCACVCVCDRLYIWHAGWSKSRQFDLILYMCVCVRQILWHAGWSDSRQLDLTCCCHLELPSSRQRWITAATCLSPRQLLPWQPSPQQPLLVCGDRTGNIHVYHIQKLFHETKDCHHFEVLSCSLFVNSR